MPWLRALARAAAVQQLVVLAAAAGGPGRAPSLRLAVPALLLFPAAARAWSYNVTGEHLCGGQCNTGNGATDLHYLWMGDVATIELCEAKCAESSCPCFDWAPPTAERPRKGEHCRICPPGKTFAPLRPSMYGYSAVVVTETNWGVTFLTFFFVAGAIYLGAGVYAGRKVGRGGGGGGSLAAHIHYVRFMEIKGLCEDGVSFARGGGKRRASAAGRGGRGRRSAEGAGETEALLDKRAAKASRKEEGKGAKKKTQEKKDRKEKAEKRGADGDGYGTVAAAVPSPAPAQPAAPAAVAGGTAAGDGGRWVHVPN
jgi:hypothetical protein